MARGEGFAARYADPTRGKSQRTFRGDVDVVTNQRIHPAANRRRRGKRQSDLVVGRQREVGNPSASGTISCSRQRGRLIPGNGRRR